MKKCMMLIAVLFCSLCVFQAAMALSNKEQAELRRAMNEYKKSKSKLHQETEVINRFKRQYPEDQFVRDIVTQKEQFDVSMEPAIATR
ncbi:MAG TPA: hypothetical protein VKU36_05825 [Candidatus Babeliales bacterium]|nr:hypothetical protein [Candidatus Babeliales bacterium]